jgi:hypothetical protein
MHLVFTAPLMFIARAWCVKHQLSEDFSYTPPRQFFVSQRQVGVSENQKVSVLMIVQYMRRLQIIE